MEFKDRMPLWFAVPVVGFAVCLDLFEFMVTILFSGVSLGILYIFTLLMQWGFIAFFSFTFWLLFKLRGVTMIDRMLAKFVLSGIAIIAQSLPFIGFLIPGWTIWVLGTVLMTKWDDKRHNERVVAWQIAQAEALQQALLAEELAQRQAQELEASQLAALQSAQIAHAANQNRAQTQSGTSGRYDGVARRNIVLRPDAKIAA